jgi:hypothetical protein
VTPSEPKQKGKSENRELSSKTQIKLNVSENEMKKMITFSSFFLYKLINMKE